MSTSSSTEPLEAPTTTTSINTSSPSSPSPLRLTHSQPSSSPSAATASSSPLPSSSPQTPRHVADARAAVVASMGNMLDAELQSRAAVLHANAAALDKQQRDVVRATDALRRDTQRLQAEADKAARKVKELGNVQNWAEVLERGFLVLEETVRLANGGETDGEEGGSECSCSCSECGGGSDGSDGDEEGRGGEGDADGVEAGKGNGDGVKGVENDAVRRLRTMDLNSMSDASRSLMNILEASSSTRRAKSSGTTIPTR